MNTSCLKPWIAYISKDLVDLKKKSCFVFSLAGLNLGLKVWFSTVMYLSVHKLFYFSTSFDLLKLDFCYKLHVFLVSDVVISLKFA